MAFVLDTIDNITELKSEIQYIKRFIGRISGLEDDDAIEFYISFSLEYQPLGLPLVYITYIDPPSEQIMDAEKDIRNMLLAMEKARELKHSPFNGL